MYIFAIVQTSNVCSKHCTKPKWTTQKKDNAKQMTTLPYCQYEITSFHELLFLPRDAMRKRGLCCRPVSVRLSDYIECIVSTWLNISSNFFLSPVVPSF